MTPTETTARRTSGFARFLRYPLTWLVIGLIAIVAALVGVAAASDLPDAGARLVATALAAVLGLVFYVLVMRFVAHRPVSELAPRRALPELGLGAALGVGFIAVSVGVVTLLGGYSFEWTPENASTVVLPIVTLALGAAVLEELLFRGLALQAIEALGGSWIALAATSLFFGASHLANPGATLWGAIAIMVEAGLLLGAAMIWRRSLWFVIGLHFAWNTVEGLLGIPVSGNAAPGILTATPTGPELLSGGAFGIEASVVPVVVGVLIAVPMLVLAHRRGSIVALRSVARRNAVVDPT